MIPTQEIENKIKEKIKTSHIQVIDLRGGDHIQIILVSPDFKNKSLVEQHKIVYDVLSAEMKSNEIHALTLKTYSPTQWEKIKGSFKIGVDHQI